LFFEGFHAHTNREPKGSGFFHPEALADYLATVLTAFDSFFIL
jgi:hypothetical protein